MKYSPIKQKELQGAVAAEGRDNKAVSQYDRYVGKQVASEEARMQNLDKFADELAMRKDKLGFSKKVQSAQEKMANERLSMQEDALSHSKLFKGIEGALGVLSVGTEYWRGRKQKENDLITKQYHQERLLYYQKRNGTQPTGLQWSGGYVKDTEEDYN
jgi:hypothetical protein